GDKAARRAAAEALAFLGFDLLPDLEKLLGDSSPAAREGAARTVAFMGVPARSAAKEAAKLLRDAEPEVRVQAALAVWRLDGEPLDPLRVLDLVLKDVDNRDRWEAIEAVAYIAIEASPSIRGLTEVLVNGLKDRDARVRATSAKWLWKRTKEGKNILPLLRDAAGAKDEAARLVAAETLGELEEEDGPGPLLASLLDDRSAAVRAAAAEGLGRVGDVAAALKALKGKGKGPTGAVRALGFMGPKAKEALPGLGKIDTPLAKWAVGRIKAVKE
ncbi:MAG: HEAT repeat domain-containing protein, partial [Gemmataceae bacterium]|nr:HEAT repeat domain-containing protein [Gemmataceae bacterium]